MATDENDFSNLAESLSQDIGDQTKKNDSGPMKVVPNPFSSVGNERNLDLILDIPLRITVQLGATRMMIHELLNLGQGSVVELNKLAGEPMEVLVNDKLIARGEAVVVNEKFGVRLTDIISPRERVESLR